MSKREHMIRALLRKCHRSNSNNNAHTNKTTPTRLLSLSQHSPISSSSTPPSPEATQQAQGTPRSHKKTLGLIIKVTPDEDGMRLDRFIRHRLAQDPHRDPINNNTISKWIRKREIELVIPLSTNATHSSTSNQDTQLVTSGGDPSQSHIEESVGRKRAGERTRTFATSSTRTEAGQLWRIRPLFDPKVVENVPTNGVEQTTASLGTGRGPHSTTSTTPIPATDCLPLRDWVVYEDERIFIINKPSGIPVQGGTGVTASIASSLSVLQGIYPEKPRLVHRLDRTTSGLLILARTRKAAQDLTLRFHNGTNPGSGDDPSAPSKIVKKYLAIVSSAKPIKAASHGRSFRLQGDMLLTTTGKAQIIQMAPSDSSISSLAIKSVWPSLTDVVIVSQNFHSGTYWALLNLYPRTGRKHQLRVHCAQMLHAPILGDLKYSGAGPMVESRSAPRIYLHMAELELKDWVGNTENQASRIQKGESHRITKDGTLIVTGKPEDDMQRAMERLGFIK